MDWGYIGATTFVLIAGAVIGIGQQRLIKNLTKTEKP